MISKCPICSKQFELLRKNKKYCSPKCAKEAQKEYYRKYFKSDRGKSTLAKYNKSDKGKVVRKKIMAKYFKSEKGKEAIKRADNNEKAKDRRNKYFKTEKGKDLLKKYKKTEKGRTVAKKAQKKWLEKTDYYKNISKDPVKREKRNREASERRKKRLKVDIEYKLTNTLRSRFTHWFRRKGEKKNTSIMKLVGCTKTELKKHLESQFKDGMTWDNYGEWHIDHIKPLATFDIKDPVQVAKASHYTNLQPLWAKENLTKSKKLNYKWKF
ncbi:hypothetical protein [Candidatus Pelagibacter sp. HIMB1517]|uniref:hypothetical protein n=1 Tax=Candidatus Pelagibacter sp. HIMB1517 TaxID=3413341 RepID=UPI003F847DAB